MRSLLLLLSTYFLGYDCLRVGGVAPSRGLGARAIARMQELQVAPGEAAETKEVQPLSSILGDAAIMLDQTKEATKGERFRAITVHQLDKVAEKFPRFKEKIDDVRKSAMIFPFKASPYLVEELIDWETEGDIGDDPFYRLIFPTMDMLSPENAATLEARARRRLLLLRLLPRLRLRLLRHGPHDRRRLVLDGRHVRLARVEVV